MRTGWARCAALGGMLGCAGSLASPDGAPPADDGGAVDAGMLSIDAGPVDAGPEGIAPPGTLPAAPAIDGVQPISAAPGVPAILELVVHPDEHLGFFLRFAPNDAGVVMHVDRWALSSNTSGDVIELGLTDAGPGIRTLAVLEPAAPRTHWIRIEADAPLDATLEVVRTPFRDAAHCESDCERLLQLPLPVDFAVDGYSWTPSTIMRYWFGRRDLLLLIRHAAQAMAERGHAPVIIGDLSQWDSLTPGTDTGSLRHASHQRGKDVDITLYGTDGSAPWRSYCTVMNDGSGRECISGTVSGYDGALNALFYSGFLQSGRVTMSFLDQELIGPTIEGASQAGVDPSLLPLYSDGRHLQHWPNHNNHIHVRVSEAPYGAGGDSFRSQAEPPPVFEPP